jgi:hypothetical protein
MRPSIILICLVILSGCSSVQQKTNDQVPVLLIQQPFPYVPLSINKPEFYLSADIFIRENGTVGDVILQKGSGFKSWDSIATETIRTWQYIPRRVNNKPLACWVFQKMRVIIAEPIFYSLSALRCPSNTIADSFYNDLVSGCKFEEIANSIFLLPTLGKHIKIGKVNIYQYPEFIRNKLTTLSVGEFTKPIKYGDHFIIFKRERTVAE